MTTRHDFAFPRLDFARVLQISPPKNRGRRECRALNRTRKPRGLKRKNAHKSSGRAEIARHSLRNGFTAYSALSLVSGLFSHHRERMISVHLIPASEDQDHTALPYALAAFVMRANASIASRTTIRDDREAPLCVSAGRAKRNH